jgi:ferredoxin-NAD(P)+ reductase (naphthalene dioxygenase ferredoxin-specific)
LTGPSPSAEGAFDIEEDEARAPGRMRPPAGFAGRIVTVERPARRMTRLRLELESRPAFRFAAGQYARVAFDGSAARDYSMASRPDEDLLEFHIGDTERDGGLALHELLRPGHAATLEGPFGESVLRPSHRGPILALAGGSGLAPAKSIVETALSKGMAQPIHLYFGVRAEADLYLLDHFAHLARGHANFRFVPVLSAPEGRTSRRTGFVSAALAEDTPDLRGWKAYVYGPPAMVEASFAALRRLGLPPRDIHGDSFASQRQ